MVGGRPAEISGRLLRMQHYVVQLPVQAVRHPECFYKYEIYLNFV